MMFLLDFKTAQMFRELLELLMADPTISILVILRQQLPNIRLRRWWVVQQHKQLTQRKIQLLMVQIPAAISIILFKDMVSMLLQLMFRHM